MSRSFLRGLVACALLVVPAGLAEARQGGSMVPAGSAAQQRTWFGGGAGAVGQNLSGHVALSGGRFRREFEGLFAGQPPQETEIQNFAGGLRYGLTGGIASVSIDGNTNVGYFRSLRDEPVVSHRLQAGGSVRLTSRTTASGSQGVYYEPTLARFLRGAFDTGGSIGLLPFDVTPDLDVGPADDQVLTYVTRVAVNHQVSNRSNLSADYSHRQSDYDLNDRTQVHDQAGLSFTHQLARGLGLRLGYRYATGRTDFETGGTRRDRHVVDAGVDFNRALSLSRQTTVSFSTGTTIAKSNDRSRLYLTGRARLEHQIGRSWRAGAYYARNIRFVEGLSEQTISDQVGADLSGSLTRTAGVSASLRYARGRVGLDDDGNGHEVVSGTTALSIGVTRTVGLSFQYGYHRSLFDRDDFLLSPSLRRFGRHNAGVSVGFWGLVSVGAQYATYRTTIGRDQSVTATVSLFAPLYSRVRRSDAAR